jgi:hypothetical protein
MAMNRRRRARRGMAQDDFRARIDEPTPARAAVTLEIGEVVLRGIDVRDGNVLAGTLERELVSVLVGGELAQALRTGERPRVDGGTIFLEASSGAPAIGRKIAQAVQRSLVEPTPGLGAANSSKR